jgi:hypothetical protein
MVEIHPVTINDEQDIRRLLSKIFDNILEDTYLSDSATGDMYMVKNLDLYSIHNPYTGEHFSLKVPQEFAGPRSIWLYQSFHEVFADSDGNLLNSDGVKLEPRPCPLVPWSSAMLKFTFS